MPFLAACWAWTPATMLLLLWLLDGSSRGFEDVVVGPANADVDRLQT